MKQWSPICFLMIKFDMNIHTAIDVDVAVDKDTDNIDVGVS